LGVGLTTPARKERIFGQRLSKIDRRKHHTKQCSGFKDSQMEKKV
jgi:hypothetical protein